MIANIERPLFSKSLDPPLLTILIKLRNDMNVHLIPSILIFWYKLHSSHFSKKFLYLILNYLSNRNHFVHIDSRCSKLLHSKFCAPQRSILGPALRDLCVTNLKNCVPSCTFLWYAENSTMYRNCKAKNIESCADILISKLSNMLT